MVASLPLRTDRADKCLPTNVLLNQEMIYRTISTQGRSDYFRCWLVGYGMAICSYTNDMMVF